MEVLTPWVELAEWALSLEEVAWVAEVSPTVWPRARVAFLAPLLQISRQTYSEVPLLVIIVAQLRAEAVELEVREPLLRICSPLVALLSSVASVVVLGLSPLELLLVEGAQLQVTTHMPTLRLI